MLKETNSMSYATRSLLEATATESFKSSIKISPSTTVIGGVFTLSAEDSEYGCWFFFGGTQQGTTKLTIKIESAVVPHQSDWTELASLSFGEGLATIEPAELTYFLKPTVDTVLPPYLRLKFVAAAGTSAKFTDIFQTRRS
jgi:hypothetical protein